jgi:hypothetical protein
VSRLQINMIAALRSWLTRFASESVIQQLISFDVKPYQ